MCRRGIGGVLASMRIARSGFTLIELMIVIAIVAILAVIVVPSYQWAVMKARRTEAKSELVRVSQALERYATENPARGYSTALVAEAGAAGPRASDVVAAPLTENRHYALILTEQTNTSYTLSATPQQGQANDACKTFTINEQGYRGVTNTTKSPLECWQ